MKVEVVTPGGIHWWHHRRSDVASRSGDRDRKPRGNANVAINAFVPLANMFGYINTPALYELQGRAQFTMQFDHYDPVPNEHLVKKSRQKYSA